MRAILMDIDSILGMRNHSLFYCPKYYSLQFMYLAHGFPQVALCPIEQWIFTSYTVFRTGREETKCEDKNKY